MHFTLLSHQWAPLLYPDGSPESGPRPCTPPNVCVATTPRLPCSPWALRRQPHTSLTGMCCCHPWPPALIASQQHVSHGTRATAVRSDCTDPHCSRAMMLHACNVARRHAHGAVTSPFSVASASPSPPSRVPSAHRSAAPPCMCTATLKHCSGDTLRWGSCGSVMHWPLWRAFGADARFGGGSASGDCMLPC